MLRLGARARATRTLGTTSARSSISTRLGGAGGEAASANNAARAKQQPWRRSGALAPRCAWHAPGRLAADGDVEEDCVARRGRAVKRQLKRGGS
jgi:hypothetical protein